MIPEFCFKSVIFNMKDDMDEKFGSGALCTIGTRYGKSAKSCGVKWRGGKDQNLPILDKFQHCWQNSTAIDKSETPGLTSQALTLHALAFVFPCPLKSLVDFLWFVTWQSKVRARRAWDSISWAGNVVISDDSCIVVRDLCDLTLGYFGWDFVSFCTNGSEKLQRIHRLTGSETEASEEALQFRIIRRSQTKS